MRLVGTAVLPSVLDIVDLEDFFRKIDAAAAADI